MIFGEYLLGKNKDLYFSHKKYVQFSFIAKNWWIKSGSFVRIIEE